MYFVRSGYIYLPKASINYASGSGTFWSATPTPLTNYNSSYLLFGSPRAYASDNNVRFDGFSLSINRIIPLLSISSVVAISTYSMGRSGMAVSAATSGILPPTLPASAMPSPSPSPPLASIHQITTTITSVSPSKKSPHSFSMYFVRSGIIYLPRGSLRDAGFDGVFQESTAYPANNQNIFYLDLNSSLIYPSLSGNRHIAFSLPFRKSSSILFYIFRP